MYSWIAVPLNPCIPESLNHCIPVSRYTWISVSLNLCIPVCLYPCILTYFYPLNPWISVSLYPLFIYPCISSSLYQAMHIYIHAKPVSLWPKMSVSLAVSINPWIFVSLYPKYLKCNLLASNLQRIWTKIVLDAQGELFYIQRDVFHIFILFIQFS